MSEKKKNCVPGCFIKGVAHSPETLGDGGESPTPQNTNLKSSSFSLGALALTSVKAPTNSHTPQKVFRKNRKEVTLTERYTDPPYRKASSIHLRTREEVAVYLRKTRMTIYRWERIVRIPRSYRTKHIRNFTGQDALLWRALVGKAINRKREQKK